MGLRFLFPPSMGDLKARLRAEKLAQHLRKALGEPVEVEVVSSYADLERRLRDGDVDVAWAPPMLAAEARPRAKLLLKAIRSGRDVFRAALVGRVEDALGIDKLDGLRAAWVAPLAMAGYLLPIRYLREKGYDPDTLFSRQVFLDTYRDALGAVIAGSADVTAVYAHRADDAAVSATLTDLVGRRALKLRPFAFTGKSRTDALVLSTRLSSDQTDRLVRLLTQSSPSTDPRPLLEVCNAEAFVVAAPNDYDL